MKQVDLYYVAIRNLRYKICRILASAPSGLQTYTVYQKKITFCYSVVQFEQNLEH